MNQRVQLIATFLVIFFTFNYFVIAESETEAETEPVEVCSSPICESESQNILAKLDESVDPCENFYHFACGSFINNSVIPDDKSQIDVSTLLDQSLKEQLNDILNTTITNDDIHPFACSKKLYQACLNEELIEERALKPLIEVMESMGSWPIREGKNWHENRFSWQQILLKLELRGFSTDQIFNLYIDADMKNSSRKLFYLDQPSLGIDREYLIKGFDDEIVKGYYNYHVDTAVFYGAERYNAEVEVKEVLNFEIAMAKILTPKEERRNMTLMYNPITIREFQHLFPIHDWYKYLNAIFPPKMKITEDEEIVLTDLKAILPEFYELLKMTPNRVIVNYLMWRTAASSARRLNKQIRDRRLQFSKLLSGKLKFEKRWIECVDVVLEQLPIATSALYIRNSFKKETKTVALEMVKSIQNEFENILRKVEWMDEKTRDAAIEKAKSMTAHIAYPDELMDDNKLIEYYHHLTIDQNKFFESVLNISLFDSRKILTNYRKPINRSDWETHASVAVINAFYNANENSIQFPAGIMQGVYFHPERPKYMNYGAIGSIIGHEITHGFDDEGSQFDSNGNLVDWWEEATKQAYLEKAACIIEQYGNFTEPQTDLPINGINTQGENIADNGGIKEAYFAYKSYVEKNGEEKKLPNLTYTTKQLFWISAAQSWCSVSRLERTRLEILLDPHSPEIFRVNGPLGNMREFSDDFQCSVDSKMNPEQKCDVW